MPSTEVPSVFEELIDLLAESADRERILAFRLSEGQQQKLDALVEKNRQGTLNAAESAELSTFEHMEHVVRMLKAKVLQRQAAS